MVGQVGANGQVVAGVVGREATRREVAAGHDVAQLLQHAELGRQAELAAALHLRQRGAGHHGGGQGAHEGRVHATEHGGGIGCMLAATVDPADTEQKVIDTRGAQFLPGMVDGLSVLPLHQVEGENVALVRWAPNTVFNPHRHWGGEEILVLEGVFEDEHGRYPAGTWLRSPHLSQHTPFTREEGALIYVKTGHLFQAERQAHAFAA